jgi:thiosulfate/3-mercaptopyruvate sulfurtransferase
MSRALYENLLRRIGVRNDTVIVLYGDFDNWFAPFAFWVLKYYGYEQVMLLNGGT